MSLEFVAEKDSEVLLINISEMNMLDVPIEGVKETGSNIEWNTGEVKKGETDSLDFQCKCNEANDMFLIEVYFSSTKIYLNLEFEKLSLENKENVHLCFRRNNLSTKPNLEFG